MKGFIVYPSYKIKDGKAYVHLYGRLENSESFVAIIERKAYFYIKESDFERAKSIIPIKKEETDEKFKNFEDEPVVKLIFDTPKEIPDARKILQDEGINCYEADILFAYRFLIDANLKGTVFIDGQKFKSKEYNSLNNTEYFVDNIFINPKIIPDEFNPKLKVLSFDIETDIQAEKLYSISVCCDNYKKVLINKKGIFLNAETFDNEKKLIERFLELVKELDPDIITGWNVIDFDLEVLRKICKKNNIEFRLGRDNSTVMIKLSDSFYQDSIAKAEGRIILDGISLLKTSYIKLPDYKLETAAQLLLGKEKIITGDERFKEITEAYEKDPQKLIDYNLKDSELVIEIIEKTNALNLSIARSKLTRMQIDRVKASIASFDSLYIEKLQKKRIVAPTAFAGEREERIKGGYVRESIPGIYTNILVFDFKSLYPSIIRTFNIDPYCFVPKNRIKNYSNEEIKKFIKAPNGAYFRNEEGILPLIIQELWEQRDKAKKEKDELKSYAIKIIMNSFFGVLANPTCRFYSIEMANAITHFGQFLIKLTADEMIKKGYNVIYGDTDSIFLDIHEKDYNKAVEKGKEISNFINSFFKEYIKKNYNRDSKMEIEFEKVFKKFFMPTVRKSDSKTEIGAKKRYAGIVEENGKEDIEFTGLEFVRSDWTEIAKHFQKELLWKVFNGEKVGEYIKEFIKDLRKGKYDDKLIYRKQIRKSVEEYTKTTPPHIKAAQKIGRNDTGVIYYVMTEDGPEEIEHIKHKLDYEHYIEKQIKPIAESVLAFYPEKFENLIKSHKQNSLFDY